MTGKNLSAAERTYEAVKSMPPPLSYGLYVHRRAEGPIITLSDEFYKVGPGPSSSHTIGPMRITYDFYQRAAKLPAAQLDTATKLQVNLFGSLSATGKGHGTERASLAGLIGMKPATVDPLFLDSLRDKPDQSFTVKLGKGITVTLKDIIYDAVKGDFHHQNTMTCKLLAGDKVLLEQEYYSVGGGFIEWKGYTPPKKSAPKYPFQTMKELRAHADGAKLSIGQVMLANEVAISGKTAEQVNAFIDEIIAAMLATVKSGLSMPEDGVLPGPIKLHSKAATVYKRAQDEQFAADRGNWPSVGGSHRGIRGERSRPPRYYCSDWRIGRRYARYRLRLERGTQDLAGEAPRRHARRPCGRLPLQASCDPGCGRGRMPGGDRRGFGYGSRIDRNIP